MLFEKRLNPRLTKECKRKEKKNTSAKKRHSHHKQKRRLMQLSLSLSLHGFIVVREMSRKKPEKRGSGKGDE
jgi:hypothetical protein